MGGSMPKESKFKKGDLVRHIASREFGVIVDIYSFGRTVYYEVSPGFRNTVEVTENTIEEAKISASLSGSYEILKKNS
jgi:heat shock protein HspQ